MESGTRRGKVSAGVTVTGSGVCKIQRQVETVTVEGVNILMGVHLPLPRFAAGPSAFSLQLVFQAATPRARPSSSTIQLAFLLLCLPNLFHYGQSRHAVIFFNCFRGLRCAHPKMALTPPQDPPTDVVANLGNKRRLVGP